MSFYKQCIVGFLLILGMARAASQSDNLLEDGAKAFGSENYLTAQALFERCATMHPQQAPLLYFYIGECYYRTDDIIKARQYFEKAYLTIYNKDEAAERLVRIMDKQGNVTGVQPYRDYLSAKQNTVMARLNDSSWFNAQPQGDDEDRLHLSLPAAQRVQDGYANGMANGVQCFHYGRPSVAAFWFEAGVVNDVPLNHRFDSMNAWEYYAMLVEAYQRKAALFRKLTRTGKFNLSSIEKNRRQEIEIITNKYLQEHGDEEILEAEQLAEHFRLKALIVKTRLIAKGIKPSDGLIDIHGKPIKQ